MYMSINSKNTIDIKKLALERQRRINILFIAIAIIAFPLFLFYSYSLDDLQAFSAIQNRSYSELAFGSHGWGGTVFYRPLIDLQTKLIWDAFSGSFFAFKIYQYLLFSLFLLTLNKLVNQLQLSFLGVALLMAMVMSSRAIHDAFLWWVNMGQAMVLVCFALLLNFLFTLKSTATDHQVESGPIKAFSYATISFIALFSKEIGLVVLIGFIYLAYLERNRLAVTLLLLVFLGFIFGRILVIGGIDGGGDGFMASSGFGFSYLSSGELRNEFDNNKYLYYFYNILAQFLYVLFRQPVDGQFMTYTFGLRGVSTLFYVASSGYLLALFLRKVYFRPDTAAFLLAVILVNSFLSFPYARERIMVVADLAVAVLFALIVSALHTTSFTVINKYRLAVFQGLGVIAGTFILLITFLRATRRYINDFSNSTEAMRAFIKEDYRLITEKDGPLPPMVMDNVIGGLNTHYQQIISAVDFLSLFFSVKDTLMLTGN